MTAPTAKQVNDAEKGLNALARASEDEAPTKSEVHTYADGTQVVGVPPFPVKSPRELHADEARGIAPMAVPQGMKQSGENVSDLVLAAGARTPEQVKFDAEQQLTSDVLSGKDPHTPNPTTASDKPVLAGTGNVITAGDVETPLNPEPTAEDLERIAAQIEPNGEIDATDEQKEGAAVQIVRETKGPVVAGKTSAKKK